VKELTFKIVFINIILLMFVSTFYAQGDVITKEEKLVGSSSDFSIGIHSGIFDCNQTYKYPYNVGAFLQYNYTPNVMKNWFVGAEAGAFFTQGSPDDYNRETNLFVGHVSLYPGYSITLDKKEYPEELDFESKINARKLKFAAGLTLGMPLKVSDSNGVSADNAKIGFGFTGMVLFDVTSKLSVLGSMTRVGADMDGKGYTTSGEVLEGNNNKASYWYKVGLSYNLMAN